MSKSFFPEKCLIPLSSREVFAKVAAENELTLSQLCGFFGRGECKEGGCTCNFIPDVEPFPKKGAAGLGGFPT